MKAIFVVLFATMMSATSALAATALIGCDARPNLIFDGVRTITLSSDSIQLVDETRNGASKGYSGQLLRATPGAGAIYHLTIGVQVYIPESVLNGQSGKVEFSSYDYPYESSVCALIR